MAYDQDNGTKEKLWRAANALSRNKADKETFQNSLSKFGLHLKKDITVRTASYTFQLPKFDVNT
jgi:hypothetical protein